MCVCVCVSAYLCKRNGAYCLRLVLDLTHSFPLHVCVCVFVSDRMEPAVYPLGFDIDEIEAVGLIGVAEGEEEGGREEL